MPETQPTPDAGPASGPVLPTVVTGYQAAHDRRDTESALAAFAETAVVEDDGHRYEGLDRIRHWLESASAQFQYTRTLLGATDDGDGAWLVTSRLDGNFPGGTVDLRYRFVVRDDLIVELVIAP